MSATASPAARRLGGLALAGVLAFALVAAAAQALRGDLDWRTTPLSFYLLGPYAAAVQAAYLALAAAIAALACGYYRALAPAARSAAPLLLFLGGAAALVVVVLAPTDPLRPAAPTLHGVVHVVAANAAFLCVGTAMLLQAWRLRSDGRWRAHAGWALALAALAFAAIWTLTLWRTLPRGLAQKGVIALVLLWLGAAAQALRRGA